MPVILLLLKILIYHFENDYLSSFLPFGATNPRPAKIDNTAGVNTAIFMVILIYFNILFFTYSIILFGVSISP